MAILLAVNNTITSVYFILITVPCQCHIIRYPAVCSNVQMLIYEGASCLHGRRSKLKGRYDAALYLHYRPTDTALWNYTIEVRWSGCRSAVFLLQWTA
jgi:hypothetical protein